MACLSQADLLLNSSGNDAMLFNTITTQLVAATTPNSTSLSPTDLNTTNYVLAIAISYLESDLERGSKLVIQSKVCAELLN